MKVISFPVKPAPSKGPDPEKIRVLICRCGNALTWRIYETGEIQCRECDQISSIARSFNPEEPPPNAG